MDEKNNSVETMERVVREDSRGIPIRHSDGTVVFHRESSDEIKNVRVSVWEVRDE